MEFISCLKGVPGCRSLPNLRFERSGPGRSAERCHFWKMRRPAPAWSPTKRWKPTTSTVPPWIVCLSCSSPGLALLPVFGYESVPPPEGVDWAKFGASAKCAKNSRPDNVSLEVLRVQRTWREPCRRGEATRRPFSFPPGKNEASPNSFECGDARTALPQNCSPRKVLEVQPACELHFSCHRHGTRGLRDRLHVCMLFWPPFDADPKLGLVPVECGVGRIGRKRAVLVCIALQFHIGHLVLDTS